MTVKCFLRWRHKYHQLLPLIIRIQTLPNQKRHKAILQFPQHPNLILPPLANHYLLEYFRPIDINLTRMIGFLWETPRDFWIVDIATKIDVFFYGLVLLLLGGLNGVWGLGGVRVGLLFEVDFSLLLGLWGGVEVGVFVGLLDGFVWCFILLIGGFIVFDWIEFI